MPGGPAFQDRGLARIPGLGRLAALASNLLGRDASDLIYLEATRNCHIRISLWSDTGAKLSHAGGIGPPTAIRPMIRSFLLALCLALVAPSAWAQPVVGKVRIGEHPDKTRFVM